MPNMDDVWLTIMHSAMDSRTAGGPLVSPPVDRELSQPEKDSTTPAWKNVYSISLSLWSLKMRSEAKAEGQTLL